MLYDDDGVAQVAQLFERGDEPFVVALVQADGWLVEDVEHVDELRSDLCGQSYALALAAGERCRLSVECEVVESHVEQEVEPCADLLENLGGDLHLLAVEVWLHIVEPLSQLHDVHRGEFRDVLVPDAVGEGLSVEPLSVALGALALGHELVCPLLCCCRLVVVDHVAQVFDDAVEGDEIVAGGVDDVFVDAYVLQRAVEYLADGVVGELGDGCLHIEAVFLQDGLNLPEDHLVLVFPERDDASFMDAQPAVGHHLGEVYLADDAQTLAVWAGALGGVEREVVRRRVGVADAGGGAHQTLGEVLDAARVFVEDHDQPVALLHGDGDRLLESVVVTLDLKLVYDHLDVVVLVAVYLHAARDLHQLAVDADVQVSLAAHRLEELAVVALAASHQGGEDEYALGGILVEDHVDDALLGVFHHLLAGGVAVGAAGAGEEQAQVVVDLGGRPDGRARILVGGFLLNADHGREAGDLVDVGALHAAEEVAGVGREGLDIPSLSFGEDGVEGEARLPGAAEAGDDGERVVGDDAVDVLQVVYTGAVNVDACLFFHVCVVGSL